MSETLTRFSEVPRRWGYRENAIPGIALHDGKVHNIPCYERITKVPGPILVISSGMHPGPETGAIAAVIEGALALTRFPLKKGRIVVVPQANNFAMLAGTHDFPYGGGDWNRVFPGKPNGSLAEIAAHKYYSAMKGRLIEAAKTPQNTEILPGLWLDFHNENLSEPYVRIDRKMENGREIPVDAKANEMADALGITVVREYPLDIYSARGLDHSVTGAATNDPKFPGIAMTVELGESNETSDENVGVGIRTILRMAAKLGIIDQTDIPAEILQPEPSRVAVSGDRLSLVPITSLYGLGLGLIRITRPGYPVIEVSPNQRVKRGERLGRISSPADLGTLKSEPVVFVAPCNGLIISLPTQGDYIPGKEIITMAVDNEGIESLRNSGAI